MSDLLEASPPTTAFRCLPMTSDEIDRHPDADRIWATICNLRSGLEGSVEEAENFAASQYEEGYGDAVSNITRKMANALDEKDFNDLPDYQKDRLNRIARDNAS